MDEPGKAFGSLPAARPGQRGCLGSARLFSYFLSYIKMQNFVQHPGRGVSLLSSIKFHLENIRGSPVQVVERCPLFLQAPGRDVPGSGRDTPTAPALPKAAPAPGLLAAGTQQHIAPQQPQERSAEAGLSF